LQRNWALLVTEASLRAIPADQFIQRAQPPYGAGGSSPNVDAYFLTADPMTVYREHREQRVPLIIGSNGREFPGITDQQKLKASIQDTFRNHAPQAAELYGIGSSASVSPYPPYGSAGDQFVTDTMFRCAVVATAISHSTIASTFQYEFTHPLPGRESDGAAHGAELGYVFGTLFLPQTRVMFQRWGIQIGEMSDSDVALSEALQTYWTNFAKTGDPNAPSLPKWPAYDKNSKAYVEFTSAGIEQKNDLRGNICRLYETQQHVENPKHSSIGLSIPVLSGGI
jgi:para-nitrobenzyl esterase